MYKFVEHRNLKNKTYLELRTRSKNYIVLKNRTY